VYFAVSKTYRCSVLTDGSFSVITTLDAGCQQQPIPGKTVSIEGDIFSRDKVNVTEPTAVPTLPPDYFTNIGFPLAAKVGIAIGAVVLILFVAGCWIICNGKRRRRAYLRRIETIHAHRAWPTDTHGEMFETPLSQKPLRSWDDSPMSAHTATTGTFPPRYFSPYSSQYNSPVSAIEGPSMQWPEKAFPQEKGYQHEIGIALGGDDSSGHLDYNEPVKGKQRQEEAYEMHEVESSGGGSHNSSRQGSMPIQPEPPVLHHPGYGRQGHSPPRTYGLTEADARKGYAL
jgi:hypothetical protein